MMLNQKQNNDMKITEDYVPFETARLLKQKGFNVPVLTFYNPKYSGKKVSNGTALINYNADPEDGSELCSAPTLQMTIKWFRKIHNCIITFDYDSYENADDSSITETGYSFTLQREEKPTEYEYIHNWVYNTYEEAVEAAIKYCLTNLL